MGVEGIWFLLFVIVGPAVHEAIHYLVARKFGMNVSFTNSTMVVFDVDLDERDEVKKGVFVLLAPLIIGIWFPLLFSVPFPRFSLAFLFLWYFYSTADLFSAYALAYIASHREELEFSDPEEVFAIVDKIGSIIVPIILGVAFLLLMVVHTVM